MKITPLAALAAAGLVVAGCASSADIVSPARHASPHEQAAIVLEKPVRMTPAELSASPMAAKDLAGRLAALLDCSGIGIGDTSYTTLECLGVPGDVIVRTDLTPREYKAIVGNAKNGDGTAVVVAGVAPPDDQWAAYCHGCTATDLTPTGGKVIVSP